MKVGGWLHAPAALPPGKTRYALYMRLGGPQGRSERVQKISPPSGFDPPTVQPVASLYTDWAIPALEKNVVATCTFGAIQKIFVEMIGCWTVVDSYRLEASIPAN